MINKETIHEVIRFGIVGAIATIIHYAIYYVLQIWINITLAYIIGYGISFICNYFLTSYFTFKEKANVKSGIGFSGAHLFNLLFQVVLLNIFTTVGINASLAPLPVFAIAIPVNFLLIRYVFKHFSSRMILLSILSSLYFQLNSFTVLL